MTDKRSRVFLGQVYTRQGKYGTFYSGRLGAAQLIISESKEPGKWNVYIEENTQTERKDAPAKQPAFEDRKADDGFTDQIPF
jgi:hypothetical protein